MPASPRRPAVRSKNAVRAVAEALEQRRLLSTIDFNWIGGTGSWHNPANWSHVPPPAPEPDRPLPSVEDNVTIPPGAFTVTIGGGQSAAAKTITSGANLRLEGASTLFLGGDVSMLNSSTFTLAGGLNTRLHFFNPSSTQAKTFRIGGDGTFLGAAGGGFVLPLGGTPSDRLEIATTVRVAGGSTIQFATPNFTNFGTLVSDVAGGSITLSGSTASPSIVNRGTIRAVNGGTVELGFGVGHTWNNGGLIEINGGILRLNGTFRQSNLGNYTRVGGEIRITGTMRGNLALDDQSGSWIVDAGTLIGSRITRTGNQSFTFGNTGVLDGCTLGLDATVTGFQAAQIRNGLTLENGAALRLNNGGTLNVNGTQTIGGNGQVLFTGTHGNINILLPAPHTLTIDSGVVLRTDNTAGGTISGQTTDKLIVKGQFAATGSNAGVTVVPAIDLSGQLTVGNGATLSLFGALALDAGGSMAVGATSLVSASQNITGGTTTSSRKRSGGILSLAGGTVAVPRLLEVMSQDRGAVTDGYKDNFALGRLTIAGGSKVKLQDGSNNAPGAEAEAVYVDTLVVENSATLDLNGKKVYARGVSIQGTGAVTGGTVTPLSDGGPILLGLPTTGRILVSNEQDEWTFFGRAGQTISAIMNPGQTFSSPGAPLALAPAVGPARMTLLKPDGTVLGTVQGSSNAFSLSDQVLPVDGIYKLRVQGQASNNIGFYVLAIYDVTVETRSYTLNTIASGNIETPFVRDKWTFSLEAGQQIQFDLLAAETSGLQFTLEGPGGFVAFNNVTDDTALITIPGGRGGNYALTVKGATDQVGGYSFVVRDGSITPLTLGVPFAGTLPGSGSPRWFSMNLPNPGQLLVALNDSTNADRNRLYLRQGALPTQSEFDFRSTAATADQSIYVPTAQAGEWFVLVYGDFVPAASSYTLRAEYSDLRISSITPDRYGVNNTMTMTLSGGGYGPGTTVKLTAGATTINAGSVEIDSFTQITATFNLAGAAQLTFDVTVQNGAASFTLPGAFRTLANQPAKLEMKLNMPAVPTRTSVSAFSVEYANTGNVAMPAPLIIVQSADPEGDDHPVLSLDMTRVFQTFWATKLPPGVGERVMMLGSGAVPGVLNPGERMSIPINYLGQKPPIETTDNRLQLEMKCVEADEPSSQDPIDWEGLKNALKPPSVPSPIWDQAYANLTAPLTSIEHYAQMLRDAAAYLGRLGVRVVDVDDLWNFEVHKALGSFTAFPTLAAAVDAQVPGPGTSLSLTRRFVDGVIGRNIEGPFGFGWTVPWLTTLTRGADDEVITLTAGAARRVFVRDGRGLPSTATYFSEAGDSSTLKRLSSGAFDLRETGGTLTRFGADGKINFVQDLNANRVTAGYDGAGRLNALTHGSGGSIAVTYNAAGRISRVSDSLGHSVTYAYDASNDHLMSATSDDGTQLSYTYDGANSNVMKRHALLSEQMDGSTQFYSYNDVGRISSTSRTGGAQQTNVTYEQGQVTLADAAGASKVFFDHRVRVAKVTDARGFSSVMRYDKDDRLASTTMPDGSQHKYEFCDCGSLTGSTDALGRSARYTRDPITRKVTSITDTEGNVSRYTYDTAGNQVSLIHADGSVETASNFTASGLAQTFTNRRGSATTFVYDALGRVTKQTSPNSTAADYVYDARGRLATITSGTSVTSLSYDTAVDGDRLKRVTYPGGKFVEFDYDGTGRRTAVRDQDGFTTRYDYDAAGRVHHVRDTGGAALATYTYDGAGRLSRIDNGNNTFAVYGYDAAGNVLSIENFRAAGVLNSSFTYTYDSRGRRTTAATSDGTWTYGYDANGQLTAATFASTGSVPNQNIQITYDAAGNREFATINGELIDYGSNALNQVTSVDGVAFQYDADGNLTSDGTRAFTYDALGRLTQITAGADVQQFEYNAFGARSASILNGVRTNYLVMPDVFGEVLAEYDASGNVVARNVFNGTLIGRTSGGAAAALNYFDYDVTSSTAGVSDATGAYVNRYLYDPFGGSLLSNESIANPYEFNGAYGVRGEIGGLSQMGFRDYSPSLGRFTTVDPLRFDADLNTYRFADNSPTMKLDPTGLFALAGFPGKPNWGANAFYGTGVDGGQSIAIAAQTGAWPSTVDAIAGVATSFGVNAAFSANGLNGFASGIQVWLDPKVNGHHVDAICGLNLQREFGTINKSAARQMAAIQKELGGRGAGGGSGGANCYGNDESRDADMGIGDRCGYGEAGLVHAFDPNDKLAPVGFGPDNRVAIESPVAYTIDFENIGPGSVDDQGNPFPIVATAPAQRVFITDQLSSHLDFGTVRFTEFSFGETIIPVADGFGAVNASLPMSLNGATFEVLIAADIDVATGLLSVVLQAVDPVTGLPPAGLVGLLPPEDGTGNGMGYVKFAVRPRADVADGTPIRNIAHIRFDANDVIPTNQVNPLDPTQGTDPAREALVTIDALAPTVIAGPTFDFDAASPRLTIRFSEDVRDSLSVGSVTITDLTHGGTIAPVGFNYDTLTNTATFDLGAALDGANYHLLLPSANVADGVGHHAAGDITLDFFHLPGDANHDGRVNLADFNILAANFGQSNRTFSQGDFNYDTVVNLSDFNILAGRFGQALAPHSDGSRAPDDARTETELRKLLDEIT